MLLVIDIGNTNIVMGLYHNSELLDSWRIQSLAQRTADEYGILFRSFLEHREIKLSQVEDVIISSVVPPLTGEIERMCRRYFRHKPMIVGPGIKTGMPILYNNPSDVGADRIVNAIAAFERYHSSGVVVDFGTATTFDAISQQGEYLGGAIAPGIGIGAEALFIKASKLPRVNIEQPPSVIGRSTVHSIQAGLFFGYVGLTDEVVIRMQSELGGAGFVIATGGLAPLIAAESKTIQCVLPDLTLEGLRIIYERNRSNRSKFTTDTPLVGDITPSK